jgi:hypothetical protein
MHFRGETMKEHKIITKLRRPLENFSSYDLDELIQAYDEVRAECNRVKEDVSIALRQPYWMNPRQEWDCPKCGKLNYGTASLCDCMVTTTKNFKLCMIDRHGFAYFTTKELSKQWGDDWNDAPYEHNAGTPYEPTIFYYSDGRREKDPRDWNEDGTPKWEIYKVAYDYCGAETPGDMGPNSRYSVEMINNKLTPWLMKYPDKALFAGASVDEFVTFIEECGGTVYLPKEKYHAET